MHDKRVDYVPYARPAKKGALMQHKLDLYYYDECPYCQKVLRAMRRLDIEDKITLKNILRSQEAANTLVRVGGKRQVPCLFIDCDPMYESDDIVAYLERTFA
jgi:glutaredoxin